MSCPLRICECDMLQGLHSSELLGCCRVRSGFWARNNTPGYQKTRIQDLAHLNAALGATTELTAGMK